MCQQNQFERYRNHILQSWLGSFNTKDTLLGLDTLKAVFKVDLCLHYPLCKKLHDLPCGVHRRDDFWKVVTLVSMKQISMWVCLKISHTLIPMNTLYTIYVYKYIYIYVYIYSLYTLFNRLMIIFLIKMSIWPFGVNTSLISMISRPAGPCGVVFRLRKRGSSIQAFWNASGLESACGRNPCSEFLHSWGVCTPSRCLRLYTCKIV